MTYSIKVIFDGTVNPATDYISTKFNNARFILLDTPSLPLDQGIDIAFGLRIYLNLIGRTVTKDVILPSDNFVTVYDSFYVIYIPSEYADSNFEMDFTFNFGINIDSVDLRVYVFTTDATNDLLKDELDQILEVINSVRDLQVGELLVNAGIVANQLAQNTAIAVLGASLAPLTLGASLAVEPPLLGGSAALLLPGGL